MQIIRPLILGKGYVGNKLFAHLKAIFPDTSIISKQDADYTDKHILFSLLSDQRFNFVINCCGYTGIPNVDACEKNKELCSYLNVSVPCLLNSVCEALSVKFINVTSGCIYSGFDKKYSEKDYPNFGLSNLESSYYSFTKHLCEKALANTSALSVRIRMPFSSDVIPKNLIFKILKYNNIIDIPNSATSIDDLCIFFANALQHPDIKNLSGPLNVVNPGPITGKQISEFLGFYNLKNPNWQIVDISELNIVAKRSNCILSDKKIKSLKLELPCVTKSLKKAVEAFASNYAIS